ncbi:nephrin-like isoform X3 [Artemia franciscana]|uniref:nephrin-like isoform X3 n=1 Tax=Artemia franciscana TaxID=6661 RepID=UPI0032DA18F7
MNQLTFLCCLFAVTYAAVDISPVNPLVKAGEEITLMCRSSKPLEAEDCVWTLNGVAIRVRDTSRYTRSGVLERGECGIKFVADERDQGKWLCTVYEGSEPLSRDTNITLYELPTVSLVPVGNIIEVVADEETILTCRADRGRPEPKIRWLIGDMPVESTETNVIDRTINGHVSLESRLIYRFKAEDHKKPIRCTAGIESGNAYAVATLNVLFGPQADQQESIQYGFVVGQPGSVVVNISANPPPSELTWYIGDVQVNGMGGSSSDGHFTARMVSSEDVLHRSILNITQLTQVDATQTYVLKATSIVNGVPATTEYRMRLSSEPEPVRDAASAGGSTIGIIVAVLAILVILAIVLVTRAKGLLCFKPRTRADSEAQINPDAIQNGKDKENHAHTNETIVTEKHENDKPTLIEDSLKEENDKKDKDTPV